MPEINSKDVITIDESGFPLNMTKSHGRCSTSERLKMPVPMHGENISAIGAISKNRILDINLVIGTIDQSCVETFIKYSVVPKLKPGNILLIDNAPVHNIDKINEELLKPVGAIALPLPRYSPDLSPIEMCWSKLKEIIRGINPRTPEEIFDAFNEAILEIDSDDLEGWYEHCGWN